MLERFGRSIPATVSAIDGFLMCWRVFVVGEQERLLDPDVVAEVCSLQLEGSTPEKVVMAVQRRIKRVDFRVAYELLLGHKKANLRKEGEIICMVPLVIFSRTTFVFVKAILVQSPHVIFNEWRWMDE